MAVMKKDENKNLDVYLLLVIVTLVFSLGGGLWLVGKSVDTRLDELAVRFTSQTGQLRGELFELRKDMEELKRATRELQEGCKAIRERCGGEGTPGGRGK